MVRKKERRLKLSDFGTGLVSATPKETKDFGEKVANNLRRKNTPGVTGLSFEALAEEEWTPRGWRSAGALVLALVGNLGSGKTTFVQGLAKGLGVKQRIVSPTFIIMRSYGIDLTTHNSLPTTLYHVDLYRLEENVEQEMKNLGMDEVFSDPENVVVIEWAEKAEGLLPENTVWISFKNLGESERRITVNRVNQVNRVIRKIS